MDLTNFQRKVKQWLVTSPPDRQHAKYSLINEQQRRQLGQHLKERYFSRNIWGTADYDPEFYLSTGQGKRELDDLIDGRLFSFRRHIIPWLDSLRALNGARILEIGFGTGSSTVALAEQGASVVGIDIDDDSIFIAKQRCRLHGVQADLSICNAQDMNARFSGQYFDYIIFFACIEHMTHLERQEAIRGAWEMLADSSLLVVIETPNRLWWYDGHSSNLPFFHWLPDDLALQYAKYSPRALYNAGFRRNETEDALCFLRHGRGVSFHDIELALGSLDKIEVVSSLFEYEMGNNPLLKLGHRMTKHGRFHNLIHSFRRDLSPAFFLSSLDIAMRRRSAPDNLRSRQ